MAASAEPLEASAALVAEPAVRVPDRPAWPLRLLQTALAIMLLLCVALNFANVVGRYVVGRTIHGADEVQIYALVAIAFLGGVLVSARDAQLRMDLLVAKLPARARRGLRLAEQVLLVAVCGFVCWHSTHYAMQMRALGARSDDLRLPTWLPHALVAIGFGGVTLIALIALWRRRAPGTTG